MSRVSESAVCLRLYDIDSLTCKWPFQGNDRNCFDSNVGVCSSSSIATRRGTRNLIYILAFILLKLLTICTSTFTITTPTLPSSSIVAVLIAKAGHV